MCFACCEAILLVCPLLDPCMSHGNNVSASCFASWQRHCVSPARLVKGPQSVLACCSLCCGSHLFNTAVYFVCSVACDIHIANELKYIMRSHMSTCPHYPLLGYFISKTIQHTSFRTAGRPTAGCRADKSVAGAPVFSPAWVAGLLCGCAAAPPAAAVPCSPAV